MCTAFCLWPREVSGGCPVSAKLLLITTGNIHNNELLSLFVRHEETLFRLLAQHEFIELSRSQVIVHR